MKQCLPGLTWRKIEAQLRVWASCALPASYSQAQDAYAPAHASILRQQSCVSSVIHATMPLRHINSFYHLGYGLNLKMSNFVLRPDIGVVEIYDSKQTITMEDPNSIRIDESNFKNDNSVEGCMFAGLACTKKVDTKFDIGIKARVCYLVSTNNREAVALTSTPTYHFLKKPKHQSNRTE